MTNITSKLESIISGHKINADDADWLRALAASAPDSEVGINGLTEAETNATASVAGLVGAPGRAREFDDPDERTLYGGSLWPAQAWDKLRTIGFASVVDIEAYAPQLHIGPHLPGVRDVAMYTKDQLKAAVNHERATLPQRRSRASWLTS